MRSTTYSRKWYQSLQRISMQCAREIVPVILSLIQPRSVIDLGCGTGDWLAVFRDLGVSNVTGVDGDYVHRDLLAIDKSDFITHDLTVPFKSDQIFDLAISLETAEHIPEEFADVFIDSLVGLSPVVVFSAAPPYQGGNNHVNEQWPEYWAEKFEHRGYVAIDCLRRKIWQNDRIYFCYRQNTLIFVRKADLAKYPHLQAEEPFTFREQLSIIHPSNPCLQPNRTFSWFLHKVMCKILSEYRNIK